MNHLYYLNIGNPIDAQQLNRLFLLLPTDRRLETENIKHIATKNKKICAYALIYYLAKIVFDIDINMFTYKTTELGKPYFVNSIDFCFNISHTLNAIVVGISNCSIGIDVEQIRPAKLKMAHRFFCDAEIEYVYSGRKDTQELRFFEVWTRKEAIVKYKGTGIREPLNQINTFADMGAAQVYTFQYQDAMISCCCEGGYPPFGVEEVPVGALLSMVQQ